MYTHFVYTVPHIAREVFFNRNSIPTTVGGTVYTPVVYTTAHIARGAHFLKEILYVIPLEERCTHILYTPFLI